MDTGYMNALELASDFGYGDMLPITFAGVGAILAFYIITILITLCIYVVLTTIGLWKIFEKAGEKGWKALIPFYNLVVLFKLIGLSPWLVLIYATAFIPFIGWITVTVLNVVREYKLATSFGKGAAFTVGLIFLTPIFYMILGFSNAEYEKQS